MLVVLMVKRKESESLESLETLLKEVKTIIEDDIQNIGDCKRILIRLEKKLFPTKKTLWGRAKNVLSLFKYK